MDNTQKFSGKADVYQQARPNYAQALLDFIAQTWGLAKAHWWQMLARAQASSRANYWAGRKGFCR